MDPHATPTPSEDHAPDVLGTLTRLIRGQRAGLVHVARREGLGPHDAVDCVHDALCAFLQMAIRREAHGSDAALGRTLVTMVKNAARNKRRRHHLARPHAEIDAFEPAGDVAFTDDLLAEAEEHVRLRACVARLCDTQRAVVTLRFLEEQPGEDVAAILGIARGHVDVLLHRAKLQLRACMAE